MCVVYPSIRSLLLYFFTATSHFASTKPKGTDDDFKTAACAGSLVKVAQQFVGGTSKKISKRFTVAR